MAEESTPPTGSDDSLAASTTDHATTACSLFLDLPGELRNRIYRYALVTPERILLRGENKKQPALLRVSRQVRKEAIKIYYDENEFAYHFVDLAGAPGECCYEIVRRYRSEGRNNFVVVMRGGGTWKNLLAWVKARYEYRHLPCCWVGSQSTPTRTRVAHAAFDIATEMRSQPWTNIEAVLEAFHRGVAAENPAWV